MGEYERMVLHFTATVVAPQLALLLLAVTLIALAALAVRLVRVAAAAVAPFAVLRMVTAWLATASDRVVGISKRARAPSEWELLRV